jgi:mono/diheme cytochrome c family protein
MKVLSFHRSSAFLAAATLASALTIAGSAYAVEGEYAQQQRGLYLVTAGDCVSCHTAKGGGMLAGGAPIQTPFGVIYSSNLTPNVATGIGSWSDDQFYRAMHNGIAADGSHLYPAFPYPWFTKVTRQDVDAIRAYLRTVPAVKNVPPANKLPWPLSDRIVMAGWNKLYFKPGTFQPDAGKSAQWNRGAYIVEGLGHCGACHTPKNIFGAIKTSERFHGSDIQDWFAPSLSGSKFSGLGSWSPKDIGAFLKTGKTDRTVAYGPMAEVVENSTSKMSDDDLIAVATYLKSLSGPKAASTASQSSQKISTAGEAIYNDACSACHQKNGEGTPRLFPSLKGDAVVQSTKATTVIRLILNGGHAASTKKSPTSPSMPAFGWKLSDSQVAAVASYVRSAWGNKAPPVSAGDVSSLRKKVKNAE